MAAEAFGLEIFFNRIRDEGHRFEQNSNISSSTTNLRDAREYLRLSCVDFELDNSISHIIGLPWWSSQQADFCGAQS